MWTDSSPEYCANHVRHFFRENGRAISSATGLNFKLWDEKKIKTLSKLICNSSYAMKFDCWSMLFKGCSFLFELRHKFTEPKILMFLLNECFAFQMSRSCISQPIHVTSLDAHDDRNINRDLKIPVFRLYSFISMNRPMFTPEKWLGYWVAWWLVIIK